MDHIEALRQLVEADRWIERVRAQRDHLPERTELADVEGELRQLLADLKAAQAVLDPAAASLEVARQQTAALEQRAAQLAATLATSTAGGRELEAIQHELDGVRAKASDAETVELELMETVEPLEGTVREIKERAQPFVSRRTELQATIAELEATLNEEIAALQENRAVCHEAVVEPWRSRYDAALARVGGAGGAFVDGGRCDGCRIALAPLDLDRFKHRAEGDVMECPECGRILLG